MSADVTSFGCRLNAYESEIIRGHLQASGTSGTVVVNTCAVTAEAVRQSRQTIRKLRRENPTAQLVVTGCAAQIEPHRFAAMPEVDRVVGNQEKLDGATWSAPGPRLAVSDIMQATEAELHPVDAFQGHTRGIVQVQNGCDHRCTFCVIPFGRGNSRSTALQDVVAQVRRLVAGGHREVVLTGVDITGYAAPGAPRFGVLVKEVLRQVPDLERLRLSSVDSVEADADLLDAFANEPRLMPHLHLSLQAGDDLILKRMKRRHSRADAIRFCDTLRKLRPDIVFGGDIIAGFPTETEPMFTRSLDLVEECGLTHLHVFPFSPRPGTPAARMPPVQGEVIRARAYRLREKGAAALARHLAGEVGARRRVLTELGGIGRTEQFTPVRFATKPERGLMLDVIIAGHDGRQLLAA